MRSQGVFVLSPTLTEVRWHARGGQGAVTAAKMVAELAVERGKHFQAFPEYGPERSGAPIVAFTRISDEPIQTYAPIESPNVIMVLDPTLLSAIDVTDGAPEGAVVIVNTDESPDAVRASGAFGDGVQIVTIAATIIAKECLGRNLPNTPMVGAVAKVTGLFTLEEVEEHLSESFGKKFAPKVVEGNLEAVRRAYNEVKQ
jgi:pyruvate ferredoxin oxidoreductase gamma subunit